VGLGQQAHDGVQKLREAFSPQGRDGHDFLEVVKLGVALHERQKLGLLDSIDFVERQDGTRRVFLQQSHSKLVSMAEALGGVDNQHRQVALRERLANEIHHLLVKAGKRPVDSGRVHEHDLRAGPVHNAQNPIAGGLRYGGDDGNLGPNQPIHQGALAGVRPSHDRNESGFNLIRHGS